MPFIFTFVAVSLQGKRVTGIHGIGDPPAAATVGLAEVVHIPKGIIFRKGILSSAFPAGKPVVVTPFIGSTTNGVGTVPHEHFKRLSAQVALGIIPPERL
jgi:hypothetical protein